MKNNQDWYNYASYFTHNELREFSDENLKEYYYKLLMNRTWIKRIFSDKQPDESYQTTWDSNFPPEHQQQIDMASSELATRKQKKVNSNEK